jgi:LysR family glycine cleavage system transcriptional activator
MPVDHRLPPLNALRAFEAVVRLGSMAQAAEALAVTPGAISQQVRLLESVIGVSLFRREGRQLVPTEAGLAAAALAGEAFDQLARAVALMRQPAKRDRLTVSVAPSFAGKWLAPRLFGFQEAHPELEVWVSADSAKVDLGRGAADLAIRYGPGEGPRGEQTLLLQEEVLPVCSPDLLARAPIPTPEALAGQTLLHDASPESEVDGADWATWLRGRKLRGISVRGGPRFNQSALVIDAAVAGRGVALAKRTLAQNDLRAGRLVSLFPDGAAPVKSAYYVLQAPERELGGASDQFLAWLLREARSDADAFDEL